MDNVIRGAFDQLSIQSLGAYAKTHGIEETVKASILRNWSESAVRAVIKRAWRVYG